MALRIETLVTGDLQENCHLVWDDKQNHAVVIDPGGEAQRIARLLKKLKLDVAAFLQTHCHGDHMGALGELKATYPEAPICVGRGEAQWLEKPTLNLSCFIGAPVTAPAADRLLDDAETIEAGGLTLKAIHVPGHSPGSMAYFLAGQPPHLFSGDALFAGSIGRTDLPGGAGEKTLVENIRAKLLVLPGETIVHPGHGPETTIDDETANNPYV